MRASVSVFVHHLALTLCFCATFCDLSKKRKPLNVVFQTVSGFGWWSPQELNRGHMDFQSIALPLS